MAMTTEKDSFFEGLYRQLWSRIGGRPWTEIIRDEQKKAPLAFLIIFLIGGILLVKFGHRYWWQILIGLLAGILVGHFWW